MSRLKVIQPLTKKERFERDAKERAEQYWEAFSTPTAAQNLRLKRLQSLLLNHIEPSMVACDLGCGDGELSRWLFHKGLSVSALDISQRALTRFRQRGFEGITLMEGCLPYVKLPEESFDLVVLADVVAEIDEPLHRLVMSECAALLKRGGRIALSTPLDVHSYDALDHFLSLVATEFEVLEMHTSSHRFAQARFVRFFERVSEVLLGDGGVTHVSLVATRKALSFQ